jgi:uncharacterized protein involved in exopolysaccharide biosynthesis
VTSHQHEPAAGNAAFAPQDPSNDMTALPIAAAGSAPEPAWLRLLPSWRRLVALPLLAGVVALAATFLVEPTFTARTSFLPPQSQGGGAANALSSLGALATLANGGGLKAPADQYVTLLQSATVQDRIIDRFHLMTVYDEKYRSQARKDLSERVNVTLSKRDSVISVEVDDHSAERSAAMANEYVDELRRMTSVLAISEAQQRRAFFDQLLTQTRDKLTQAQVALQSSGFSEGALRTEPKSAADTYAKLLAQATAAEVRLQTLRSTLAPTAPEVVQQQAMLTALRDQVAKFEATDKAGGSADYVGKYREFKYQETLFELYAKQLEVARVDEAREGGLIQVIDAAQVPDRKSKPHRAQIAIGAALAAAALLAWWILAEERRLAFVATWRARHARAREA